MSTLTTSNSSLALQVEGLYPIPQNISGYATDDSFSTADVTTGEVMMGVDGKLSAGYTPYPTVLDITLQADSDSNDFFDNVLAAQVAAKELYVFNGTIRLQGSGEKFAFTRGFLLTASPMAGSKKVLQPRKFSITFQSCSKSPV